MRSFPAVVCGNLLLIPALFSQVGPTIRPESNGQLQEVEALHRARAPLEQTEKIPAPESASVPWRSLASEEGDDPTVPATALTGHQPYRRRESGCRKPNAIGKIELQYAEVRYAEAKALLDKWPPRP